MKKILFVAMLLAFCGVQAQAAAVGSRGGKRSVARMNDSSGYPISFNDDKPWKVFESTSATLVRLVDEAGVAPTQGMIYQVCIGTAAVTNWAVIYDTNTVSGPDITDVGIKIAPPFIPSTTLVQCFQLNALFTSGVVVEKQAVAGAGGSDGGVWVYWRELGGYR